MLRYDYLKAVSGNGLDWKLCDSEKRLKTGKSGISWKKKISPDPHPYLAAPTGPLILRERGRPGSRA